MPARGGTKPAAHNARCGRLPWITSCRQITGRGTVRENTADRRSHPSMHCRARCFRAGKVCGNRDTCGPPTPTPHQVTQVTSPTGFPGVRARPGIRLRYVNSPGPAGPCRTWARTVPGGVRHRPQRGCSGGRAAFLEVFSSAFGGRFGKTHPRGAPVIAADHRNELPAGNVGQEVTAAGGGQAGQQCQEEPVPVASDGLWFRFRRHGREGNSSAAPGNRPSSAGRRPRHRP